MSLVHWLVAAAALGWSAAVVRFFATVGRWRPVPEGTDLRWRLRPVLSALLHRHLLRSPWMGTVHAVVFASFWILLPDTAVLLWYGDPGAVYPSWPAWYHAARTAAAAALLAAVGGAAAARLFLPRLRAHWADTVIVWVLLVCVGVGTLVFAHGGAGRAAGYYLHVAGVLGFLLWLPWSKHLHVLTAWYNLIWNRPRPQAALCPDPDIAAALADQPPTPAVPRWAPPAARQAPEDYRFGVATGRDLHTKDALEALSCTHCGRCTAVCPVHRTGGPLSPAATMHAIAAGLRQGPSWNPPVVPAVVDDEALWRCTTCGACESACPVGNGFVDRFVRIRRHQVEEGGAPPDHAARTLADIQRLGTPLGVPDAVHTDWSQRLGLPVFSPQECDYLLFPGCLASADAQAARAVSAFVNLARAAGVRLGVLEDGWCCMETARRLGNESVFWEAAAAHSATLNRLGVTRLVTVCPHCANTFANEYPQVGGRFTVHHHAVLTARWLREGRIPAPPRSGETAVVHDPCYLARYGDADRAISAVVGAVGTPVTPSAAGRDTACCGGGGGAFFREEASAPLAQRRAAELAAGGDQVVTACPYCRVMLQDAAQRAQAAMAITDVAVWLAERLEHRKQ